MRRVHCRHLREGSSYTKPPTQPAPPTCQCMMHRRASTALRVRSISRRPSSEETTCCAASAAQASEESEQCC